jgi:hypothetical protein
MVITVAAVALALAGCGWTQPEFDAGRSRGNGFETSLTVTNASTLSAHSIPSQTAGVIAHVIAVLGDQIITQQDSTVVAYDRKTCPNSGNTACTPLWTRSGFYETSDGSNVIVFLDSDGTVEVTDLARAHRFDLQLTYSGSIPSHYVGAAAIYGDKIVVGARAADSRGSSEETMNVFDRDGCGAATCGPLWTAYNPGGSNSWRLGSNAVVAQFLSPSHELHAYDLTTGALRWTAPGDFNDFIGLRIRGSQVFATQSFPGTETDVFDLDGTQGCAGSPTVCTPVRRLPLTEQTVYDAAISDQRVAIAQSTPIVNTNTATRSFALYAADGTGCTTNPCVPLATTAPITSFYASNFMPATLTANLIFGVGQPTGFGPRTYHLLAYDAALTSGCTGSPKVCSPVADISLPSMEGTPDPLVVSGGRVYLTGTQDGRVHVLSLPGDVS